MPIHGIMRVDLSTQGLAPRPQGYGKPNSGSIPTTAQSSKSAVIKLINEIRNAPGVGMWQRDYYEHIIRENHDLDRIREDISNNLKQRTMDEDNMDK